MQVPAISISAKSFKKVHEIIRKNPDSIFDDEFWMTNIEDCSKSTAGKIKNALKILSIISTKDNRLTSLGKTWISDQGYHATCRQLAELAFPEELFEHFSEESGPTQIGTWLSSTTGQGLESAKKSAAVWLMLLKESKKTLAEKTKSGNPAITDERNEESVVIRPKIKAEESMLIHPFVQIPLDASGKDIQKIMSLAAKNHFNIIFK